MRVAVLGLVAACSSRAVPSPDASPTPIAFTLSVGAGGTRADLPVVFIDGVATALLHQTYADLATANGFRHTVELRYAEHVLATYTTSTIDCTSPGEITSVTVDLIALESGDIRFYSESVTTSTGGCLGDGSAAPDCYCPGERCAPRISLADPLFTRMACAPIGPKAAGEPCTLIDDPAGAYDDCRENLVCLAGTCTAFCSPDVPVGYPPEVRCQ